MKPLTSVSKHLMRLIERCKTGEGDFALVEGERLIGTVARLSGSPPSHLVSRCPHLLVRLRNACRSANVGDVGDCILVTDRLLDRLADASSPQACIAVFPKPDPAKLAEHRHRRLESSSVRRPVDAVEASGGLRLDYSVLGWQVSDPANVGGIARAGWCLGARRLLLTPRSANPWLPKAIRSGAGAHFALPIVSEAAEFSTASELTKAFGRVLVTCSSASLASSSAAPALLTSDRDFARLLGDSSPICLLLGSEATGLPDELMRCLLQAGPDRVSALHVPMSDPERTASLNVASTAGILLHRLYCLATAAAPSAADRPEPTTAGASRIGLE